MHTERHNIGGEETYQLESGGTNFSNDENVTSEPMCSICLNSFHVGEKVSWARHNAECCHGTFYF